MGSVWFGDAAKLLAQESRLNTEQFSVCDKTDLSGILQDYEDWYVNKFQKYPRLARRVVVPRPPPKPHRCDLHGHGDENSQGSDTPTGKKSPFFSRRRSLPRSGGSGGSIGRAASDPSLSEDLVEVRGHGRSRNSVRNRTIDNKKREELNRGPPVMGGRRTSSSGPARSPGDEKKDPSKSSSDTDSGGGGGNASASADTKEHKGRTNNSRPAGPYEVVCDKLH
ncbi:katanin p60 ATPase-containing subunit A-like 2 [Eriocheir sinensis]|uniref:katanin p60 ATPase-containing subunit A-like 2 n=1 Tax=Eriocheir sinensis TaxID=95602 RepID=UPI0021CA4D4C|nr:katanin p60 ATPase-containing subunit A-like 2 [Eriocheir sinensis]